MLTEDQLNTLRDFSKFAPRFLIIRTKSGQPRPFAFNRAQLYLHQRLQAQKEKTGKVRAVILKGRQQGCCWSENMQVLTADYKWVKLKDIKIGDRLVACDEESPGKTKSNRKQSRKFKTAIVEDKREFIKETYEVILDNGARLEVTGDHRMLCKKRGGDEQQWREINDLIVGDVIRVAVRPPNYVCQSYEDGWMAGIIDGEGSARLSGAKRLSVHQVAGKILNRMKAYFKDRDIPYKEVIDNRKSGTSSKYGDKAVHRLDIHRLPYIIEIFARCRPTRFTNDEWHLGHELPGKAAVDGIKPWTKVLSIKSLGKMKVIDLQTSEKTYICEGLVSHNSTYIQARFYHQVITTRGKKAFILTHDKEATNNLFKMAKRFYENMEPGLIPKADTENAKELKFKEFDSEYAIGTAGNRAVGRSQTIQLFHGCLAEGSKIYDPSTGGITNIEDFNIGDPVLTHNANIAKISYISSQKKQCISVKLRTITTFPLIATESHKVWTKEGFKELGQLNIDDAIGYPVREINKRADFYMIPELGMRPQHGGRQFKTPNTIFISYEFGRLIGLYLAEGHIKLQEKAPHNPCYISFTVHRHEVDRTVEWLLPFKDYYSSMNVKHRDNTLTSTVTIYGNRFAKLILMICGRTRDKHFPRDWYELGHDFNKGMVHGYLSGDGGSYENARAISAPSICNAITITLRDICASLGYGWASILYRKGSIRHGRNEKDQYTFKLCGEGAIKLAQEINKPCLQIKNKKTSSTKNYAANGIEISNGYAWLRVKEIEYVGYKTVYDFEVDHEDHSYCAIQGAVSNSEVAFWDFAEEHSKGILQAISNEKGTEVILESTANGIGNYFHQRWVNATSQDSEYQAIFLPWYWQDEYTDNAENFRPTEEENDLMDLYSANGLTHAHLSWRRIKINEFSKDYEAGKELFSVEYPFNATEAFKNPINNVFILSKYVEKARKTDIEPNGPLIIGVDVAISDRDRTAIIRRKGRHAYNLERFSNYNTMEIVGRIKRIITQENPLKVYIDCIGIGAGVVDRLQEMGYDCVEGVNVGRSANDKERFRNLRAELWSDMRDWFTSELPVQIPDDDTLHAELCSLGFKETSSGQIQIESKDDLRLRGMPSPDGADALCLTFFGGFFGQQTHQLREIDRLMPGERGMFR